MRVDFGIRAFEISVRHNSRAAVPRPDDIHHVEVLLVDQAVQMRVNKIQTARCAPMAQKPRLDIVDGERALQQRIIFEINLPDGEVVRGTPIGMHAVDLLLRQWAIHFKSPFLAKANSLLIHRG